MPKFMRLYRGRLNANIILILVLGLKIKLLRNEIWREYDMAKDDHDWIYKKCGKGFSFTAWTGDYHACKISYAYGKSIVYVFYLNVILYFRWLWRRTKRWVKFHLKIK